MVIMFRKISLVILPVLLLVTACGGSASNGRLQVVTAIYPLAFLAEAVVGDLADVSTLVPPGVEPHDYELTPSQVASLRTATLAVYQAGVSAAIDQAFAQAFAPVLETGALVPRLAATGDGHDDSGDDDHGHGYGDDPHTWLDPGNMRVFAEAVGEAVASASPEHAEAYRANAAALDARLGALDEAYRAGLVGCERTAFLTTHAAFGYLAGAYGLRQLSIAGVTPDDEPSPARLAELARQARAEGLTTVFFEVLVSPDYANTLAADLGLRVDVLDPIEAITAESRGGDYVGVMESNLAALRTANGCP